MSKLILIIETSDVGCKHTAEAVKSLGFIPIFICTMNNYQGDTLRQLQEYLHINCDDTTNYRYIMKLLKNKDLNLETVGKINLQEDVKGVISFLDSRVSVACELAKELGVPGIDESMLKMCDKGEVSKFIPEYSPPDCIIFNKDDICIEELKKLIRTYKEVIIKPTRSAGALGMFKLSSEEELNDIEAQMNSAGETLYRGKWIAQPIINGELVSLEGYSRNSDVKFIGFTGRCKIDKTESVCKFPYDNKVDESIKDRARKTIRELIRRSEFKNGYFHAEFIITNNSCFLIDANFGRIAGAGVAQQIAISLNKTPEDIFRHVICTTLDLSNSCDKDIDYEVCDKQDTLSINYGIRQDATLEHVDIPSNPTIMHTLLFDKGKKVPAMGKDNWSWVGIAVGKREELLEEIKNIHIITDNGKETAFYVSGSSEQIITPRPRI